ncbi:hypothetical protein IAT40_006407 [Kwoniella sp. CBS 6097]
MSDPRFARLKTDPRFRRPKQKDLKVEIDDRFRDVLESEEFGGKGKGKGKAAARVDARGRPLTSSHHADQLKRFYRLRSPEKGADAEGEGEGEGFVDYARGEGALYSSGSEDGSDAESEVEEEELELGGKRRSRLPGHQSESESESGSDDEDEDEDHLKIDLSENEAESAFPPEADDIPSDEEQDEEEESVLPTKRIAAVNLDWDNLRAADLYAVFNSFLLMASTKSAAAEGSKSGAALGKLLNVKIYPSEFGKERMAREEQEGPGGGIFVSKHGDKKSKDKNKGPKEAIVLQKRQQQDDDDEEESEEEEEVDADEEESDGDVLDEEGSEEFDDEEEEEEEDELDSGEEDDDAPAPRSNDRPGKEIDGLEIISDVESEAGSEDIDMDQLRQYQLERLRYFYAIATFSTVAASEYVMNECNGTEFERTANIMDLSYVPDGMDFADDEARDEATKEPKGYKGNDFVTDALRHSKVKLTWDQDDPNRVKMTRRTLTREEIEEQDFNNLVAGSGSESSSDEDNFDEVNGQPDVEDASKKDKGKAGDKKSKKAAMKERTAKLRELLLAGDDEGGDIWGKAGTAWADELEEIKNPKSKSAKAQASTKDKDKNKKGAKKDDMEITFKPGLSTNLGAGGAEEENMTSLERYQLRMKEKRARKKEKMELKRAAREGSGSESGSDSGSESEDEGKKGKGKGKGKAATKNDDFFGSDSEGEAGGDVISDTGFDEDEEAYAASRARAKSSKAKSKSKSDTNTKDKKKSSSSSKTQAEAENTEHLSALVGSSDRPDTNFSMKDILKSEKEATKRRKRRRGGKDKKGGGNGDDDADEKELGPEGWKINVKDDRFKALHEDAEYAIDPSNPHFTKTKAMQDLLAERTRIRQSKNKSKPEAEGLRSATGIKRDTVPGQSSAIGQGGEGAEEKDLSDLVQSVKRKMGEGGGKRKRHRK